MTRAKIKAYSTPHSGETVRIGGIGSRSTLDAMRGPRIVKIGILCGGGPAPGFNGVINSVTLAALARGWTVVGIPYGYSRLMAGDISACRELTANDVAGIETRGGGILFTNRANPKKSPESMQTVVDAVKALGLDGLVTVGGDDTATSAAAVAGALAREGLTLRVAHVPKTIDNDLPLPDEAPTFGFETAKDLGAKLCTYLRVDAETTNRWYLVTAMGRSAGHLSLGMAMGSGADLCIIREEFGEDKPIPLSRIVDLVSAAIAQRRSEGQDWGLVVLAEGLLERLTEGDLRRIASLELDEHGNPRMSEIDLGRAVRDDLAPRLAAAGQKVGFVTKIIGYELRCADPVAFDVQYTRMLGSEAVRFLAEGEGNGLISVAGGTTRVLRFEDLRGPDGRVPVRRVDLAGAAWQSSLPLQARG